MLTFGFAFILHQIIQLIVLVLIYIVVVTRFGFLKENEKEWLIPEVYAIKHEN